MAYIGTGIVRNRNHAHPRSKQKRLEMLVHEILMVPFEPQPFCAPQLHNAKQHTRNPTNTPMTQLFFQNYPKRNKWGSIGVSDQI